MSRRAEPAPGALAGVGSGVAWTYASAVVTGAGGLFVNGYAIRRLGAGPYGLVAMVVGVALTVRAADAALGLAVVRAVAREEATADAVERDGARAEVRAAHGAYVALGGGATVVVLLAVAVLPNVVGVPAHLRTDVVVTALLLGLATATATATSALSGAAVGRRNFRIVAISAIVGEVLEVAAVALLVTPLGLVALGIGQLVSVAAASALVAGWARRQVTWLGLVPSRPRADDVRRVAAFAAPLLVISVGSQVIAATDLFVVGAAASAGSAGLYKIGALLPTQAVGLLYQGADVVYPSMARAAEGNEQLRMTALLTRVAAYLAGLVFGVMALLRHDVVHVVAGRASSLGATVVVVFALTWLSNAAVHGLALLLIARGQQRVFVPLVAGEMATNLVLTVVLAIVVGPLGAAYATLVTVAVSNLFVLPFVVRRAVADAPAIVWRDGVVSAAAGVAVAAACVAAVSAMTPSAARLLVAAGLTSGAGVAIGGALLGRGGRRVIRDSLRAPARS